MGSPRAGLSPAHSVYGIYLFLAHLVSFSCNAAPYHGKQSLSATSEPSWGISPVLFSLTLLLSEIRPQKDTIAGYLVVLYVLSWYTRVNWLKN